jgi:hypothetical protein
MELYVWTLLYKEGFPRMFAKNVRDFDGFL